MSSTSPSHSPSFFSGRNSNSGTPPSPPRKMSLNDLYEVTNPNDDVTLYCYLATCDPVVFETTIKDV
jgi:hypothetical protein